MSQCCSDKDNKADKTLIVTGRQTDSQTGRQTNCRLCGALANGLPWAFWALLCHWLLPLLLQPAGNPAKPVLAAMAAAADRPD